MCLLLTCGCGPKESTSDWERLKSPIAAPEFALQQLDAGTVRLSGLRGRVVVMEFWATWCGPCRYSTPSLEAVSRRYRDRGVTVLLINEGESAERVRAWAKRRFTAPILLDEDERVGQRYRVEALPALFIVDQSGRVVHAHEGYGGGLERNLALILDELLTEKSSPPHA